MREFIKVAKVLEVNEISKGEDILKEKQNVTEETPLDDEEKDTDEVEDGELKQISEKNKRQLRTQKL